MKNGMINLLTNYSGAKRSLNAYRFFLMVAALFMLTVSSAHAQSVIIPSGLSAQSILQKIGQQVPNFTLLVTAVGYVLGMFFIITGVMRMKHLGESRTMMSREHSADTPIDLYLCWRSAAVSAIFSLGGYEHFLDFRKSLCLCMKIPIPGPLT